ncbi:MAG: cytochrome ubiquinol oxidase subunit I [candidate division Zixibacteria bacterium]|nr:cytochrome ubiquinol oxidase subunit I [candidate division Zixibacteria bacterium]
MEYPVCQLLNSRIIIIGGMALAHLFVFHFAIAGGLYLGPAESFARRRNDPAHLAHLRGQSRFYLLMTILFGAAIGTGICVTTRLLLPDGIPWLSRDFHLVWATVSVLFAVEFTAILLYYFGWTRLSPRRHLIIGWINLAAALLSLAAINGILGFLLAPVTWPETGNFWAGFFNPNFWPSLIFRIFACLALAGLCATFTAAREKNEAFKVRLLRRNGLLVLASIALAVPAAYWSIKALPPQVAAGFVPGTDAYTPLQVAMLTAAVLALLTLLGTIIFPRHWGYVSAGILLLCGLLSLGAFEWMRESHFGFMTFPEAADLAASRQWSPLAVFVGTFVIGLIVIVWMLRIFMVKSNTDRQQS